MLFVFCLLSMAVSQGFYDRARNYIGAFMQGYENPNYVFPSTACLPIATQREIDDKIIGMFLFASTEQWAQINILKEELVTLLTGAAASCDLNDFYKSYQQAHSLSTWVTRLWWNSVLLIRSCGQLPTLMFKNQTAAFYQLGACAKFVFPKSA